MKDMSTGEMRTVAAAHRKRKAGKPKRKHYDIAASFIPKNGGLKGKGAGHTAKPLAGVPKFGAGVLPGRR